MRRGFVCCAALIWSVACQPTPEPIAPSAISEQAPLGTSTAPYEQHWDRDDGSYGPRMTNYLQERGASWVAWCFHPQWSPQLIQDWNFTPTESGAHFRRVMQAREAGERQSGAP